MGTGSVPLSFLSVSQPCLQYWPEPGRQQYGLMEVEFVSGTANEDLVSRVFRVQNSSRVSVSRRPRVGGRGCLYRPLKVIGGSCDLRAHISLPGCCIPSCRRVTCWYGTSSFCVGLLIGTRLTPGRPFCTCWLRWTSGRQRVGMGAPWCIVCECSLGGVGWVKDRRLMGLSGLTERSPGSRGCQNPSPHDITACLHLFFICMCVCEE